MKLNDFKKQMRKPIFSWEEARRVAWQTSPEVLRLELFNWRKRGELQMLKRGLYCFPEHVTSKREVAQHLYSPCYISLEWALHNHGLLPDVPFSLTLISTRGSRHFKTAFGEFIYHKIKKELFWGYDPATLMAVPEKALLDYFYFRSLPPAPKQDFWEEMRWQNLSSIKFKKALGWAKKIGVQKIVTLVQGLENYAETEKTS